MLNCKVVDNLVVLNHDCQASAMVNMIHVGTS